MGGAKRSGHKPSGRVASQGWGGFPGEMGSDGLHQEVIEGTSLLGASGEDRRHAFYPALSVAEVIEGVPGVSDQFG